MQLLKVTSRLGSEVHGIKTDVMSNKNTSHKMACASAVIKYTVHGVGERNAYVFQCSNTVALIYDLKIRK